MREPSIVASPAAVLLAVYLLAVPLALPLLDSGLSAYDAARVAQLGLLPLLALLALKSPLPALPRRLVWALLALLALGLLSSSQAANPWMALRELLNFAGLAALAAVLASQRESALQLLPRAAALAVSAYALPVLGMALIGASQGLPLGADLPLPGFANRRYFNHVQTVALPLAVWGIASFRSPALRGLSVLGLLASAVLLWITMGRGSLLALGAAIAVLALLSLRGRREARPLALGFAACLLLAAALAALLQALAKPLTQAAGLWNEPAALELGSDHSRFGLWLRAWEMAVQSPCLGAGPMHYALGNPYKAAHPHSLPLQLLAEWGLPASLIFGLLLVWLLAALLRRLAAASGQEFQQGACLLAAWAAVIVDSFVSGLWVMPVSQTWLAMLMGLSWAWLSPTPSGLRRWNLLPLLLSGALLLHCLPELRQLPSHVELVKRQLSGEVARPRFWFHGQFGPAQPR